MTCSYCDPSWNNWDGKDSDNCIGYETDKFLQSDRTCKTWQEINSGLFYDYLANSWAEKAGKGFSLSTLECFDNNTRDGNGCNRLGEVETDWVCEHGTESQPDLCYSLFGSTWVISFINSKTFEIIVTWDETINYHPISDSDHTISIEGPLKPYIFSYVIDNTAGYNIGDLGRSFGIRMEFMSTIYWENSETITATIHNQGIIKDNDGNKLKNKEMDVIMPFITMLSQKRKKQARNRANFSIVSFILTFGTSIFIQVVLGVVIEATWLLLRTLQLMPTLSLLNLNLPTIFREFNKNLAVLNGEPTVIPNVFEAYYNSLNVEKEPLNRYFAIMNFKTNFLLLNAGRKITIWIWIFILSGTIWLLDDLMQGVNKCGKIVVNIDTKIRYSITIKAVSQSYLSMVLSTALNVYTLTWIGDVSVTNDMIALLWAVIMLYIPVISFNIMFKTSDLNNPKFRKRYKTFIIDLKTNNPLWF